MPHSKLLQRYKFSLGIFIVGLVLSGITAFPLLAEMTILDKIIGIKDPAAYASYSGLQHWIAYVHYGLLETYNRYPFIGYGTDWLAFGHLVIAMFFIGPWRQPVANAWVLRVGIVACISIVPLAFIAGDIRGIPFYWRLVDCAFGILGMLPLLYCLRLVRRMNPAVS
jgi:hypothetical protein